MRSPKIEPLPLHPSLIWPFLLVSGSSCFNIHMQTKNPPTNDVRARAKPYRIVPRFPRARSSNAARAIAIIRRAVGRRRIRRRSLTFRHIATHGEWLLRSHAWNGAICHPLLSHFRCRPYVPHSAERSARCDSLLQERYARSCEHLGSTVNRYTSWSNC